MDLNLRGKTALITGGSKGIGRGMAEQLAAEGVNLILVARDVARLGAVSREIAETYHVAVRWIEADLYSASAPVEIAAQCPDVDILINNANTPSAGSLEDIDEDQWMHNWSLKPFSYIRMLRAFLPILRKREGGVIINVIGQIYQVATNKALYSSASCSALATVTRALAHDLAKDNIRILGIGAWVVNTEYVVEAYEAKAKATLGDGSRWRELAAHLPFGRGAETKEIGDLAAFLASDKASYLTGQIIDLDGGYIGSSVPTLASGALAMR
ncbi:SDR family oxidoreductase [Sphingobium sp. SJ10-10]|uniref:SDR family oxidoreductase n=1 Tax=Sphingobium sp. SJ10-10 TaxID=3114999 RepID=UPI002E193739|nr:SDR family oxidoreductase [Sphingobium sp. SJ10-10]